MSTRGTGVDFMIQRAFQETGARHVAIIMDGNGRWAARRGMPRHAGHARGARSVRRVVERAADPSLGLEALTLYAFSSDNWGRPREEVSRIMRLLDEYLRRETARCVENDVRLEVVGRRDRLSPRLVRGIERSESATADCGGLRLRLAIDYSSRDMLLRAAELAAADVTAGEPLCREKFAALLGAAGHQPSPAPDVDLLIRTGGEQRLSDFLLWECAYAELYFTPTLWPDFGESELDAALAEYSRRERRFGCVGDTELEEAV